MKGTESRTGGSLRIGFISTRFHGLDGVSLEAQKWASVLCGLGHTCYWFAGLLDRDPLASMLVPEAFFGHPAVADLNASLFSGPARSRSVTEALHGRKEQLKDSLYEFLEKFRIDLIIPENALSLPMHVPLGMAITELIAETGIPTIAHHHDFSWERPRFLGSSCQDILAAAFPPDLPSIRHVVINSMARAELAARKGVSASLVPNVMDFDTVPSPQETTSGRLRSALGFGKDDVIFLQPTRVVSRKGIELAISLVELLGLPTARLVISHSLTDEGPAYAQWVKSRASRQGVSLHFINDRMSDRAEEGGGGLSLLHEVYALADFVTYPSLSEGFGNAFLEAVYYRKPLLVNRYPVFIADIEPRGFDVAAIDGYVTETAVARVSELLRDPVKRAQMVERNWDVARKHFSYALLRRVLAGLLADLFAPS